MIDFATVKLQNMLKYGEIRLELTVVKYEMVLDV